MKVLIKKFGIAFSVMCSLALVGCQSVGGSASSTEQQLNSGASTTPVANTQKIDSSSALSLSEGWTLTPLVNESVTYVAAEAASSILETHLRRSGVAIGPSTGKKGRYEISGKVARWHYKGNVSGKPFVALTLNITDRSSNSIVWSDSAANVGARRQTLSGLADELISQLVREIPLTSGSDAVDPSMMVATYGTDGQRSSNEPALGGAMPTAESGRTSSVQESEYFLNTSVSTDRSLQGRSTAFFYGPNPPVDELSQFDRLIVEAENVRSHELRNLKADGARVYAYLSIGEIGPERSYSDSIDPAWVLGSNPSWNSKVLDLSNPAVRGFLLAQVSDLQGDGYQGLFLDTMDSFNLYTDTDEQRAVQSNGLISLIREMAEKYPDLKLITNRGFEVLDSISMYVEAVAAESLYAGWNNAKQSYVEVPENDRQWLRGKLEHAKNTLGLDVIVIDYMPPSQRLAARVIAERIVEDGYIPWVSNPALDYVGVGAMEVIPRKVIMLFDSNIDGPLELSKVHALIAMPVEYMGYIPEYIDIAKEALPMGELKGRYAGIVTWPQVQYSVPGLTAWFEKQLADHVPVVFMGIPPVELSASMQSAMGIASISGFDASSALITTQDKLIDPEREMSWRFDYFGATTQSNDPRNTVHFGYEDKNEVAADMVLTGDFGGFAWEPVAMHRGVDYEMRWILEPFSFLRKALQLPNVPMPDVTTENGKRIWLAHIDGDALPSWAEMPGKRLGADVIYDEILKPYQLPHTISIVEAEMTQLEAYADRRERMFSTIKKTFLLDSVELASHTFSHPFNWTAMKTHEGSGKYNLPVEGYTYSPLRETNGSIAFIDSELAPEGKRTEIMLWSGDALPGEAELEILDQLGIPNMNGGATVATRLNNSMALIAPMARPVGKYVQVYAPIMNENVYTNDWLGPFDGFKRVVETLEITETPRRLKPINIYYHFYTGTKISAMKSLRNVYDWTISQDIYPIFGSDYARKVPDHRKVGVARYVTGEWKVSRLGHVRSLRVLQPDYFPTLDSSLGIVGSRKLHDGVYVHTNGAQSVSFQTTRQMPKGVHLVSSNSRVESWEKTYNGLSMRFKGEQPVVIELGGAVLNNCSIRTNGNVVRGVSTTKQTTVFTFTNKDTGNAILHCPA